mgnify:CR=1 FL=1
MATDDQERRLARLEEAVILLGEQARPKPKRWWERIPGTAIRDVILIVGLPMTVFLGLQRFDEQVLSYRANQREAQRNAAIARLDQLQDINADIYRLQSEGADDTAFAIIEAKRGQMARLTDTVFTTWQGQPDMLGRYDLNALAEALLAQERTGDALRVAEAVDTTGLGPIDAIDQSILKARIRFALGPAHDIEAARDHLREAIPLVTEIERVGQQRQMQEKILLVRLSNEFWRNGDCAMLTPMAETLAEINAENRAAGAYRDRFGVALTLEAIGHACPG